MRITLAALAVLATPALAQPGLTPAVQAQQAALCAPGGVYPPMPAATWVSVPSATSGTPRIDQYRAGKLIASYTTFVDTPSCRYLYNGRDWRTPSFAATRGCGPFTRSHSNRLWAPGDTFRVAAAVYSGPYNQPYLGAESTQGAYASNGVTANPDGVTIEGVLRNGARPVLLLTGYAGDNTFGQAPLYLASGTGVRVSNLNVQAVAGAVVGQACVYGGGMTNLTLANMRITGCEHATGNNQGLFTASGMAGTLDLDHIELDHNGGGNGPAHNAYIGASSVDPDFTVNLHGSWSHDAVYGHLFKTRAQRGHIWGNRFEGGLPQPGQPAAEAFGLDVPNGGHYEVDHDTFTKTASGPGSNGISFAWDFEGTWDTAGNAGPAPRPQWLSLHDDSFGAYARTFDGSHPLVPHAFGYPSVAPPIKGQTVSVANITYAGFCPQGGAADWRAGVTTTLGAASSAPAP